MVQILIFEKNGDTSYNKITSSNELYKKCGFRKTEGFDIISSWHIESSNITIELWGRIIGKGNLKNNYKFSIPIDKLIYGNCTLVAKTNDSLIDLTSDMWSDFCNEINNASNKLETLNGKVDKMDNELDKLKNLSLNDPKIIDKSDISNKSDVSDSSDISNLSDLSDNSDNSDDSELKKESYVYSSEEEVS